MQLYQAVGDIVGGGTDSRGSGFNYTAGASFRREQEDHQYHRSDWDKGGAFDIPGGGINSLTIRIIYMISWQVFSNMWII